MLLLPTWLRPLVCAPPMRLLWFTLVLLPRTLLGQPNKDKEMCLLSDCWMPSCPWLRCHSSIASERQLRGISRDWAWLWEQLVNSLGISCPRLAQSCMPCLYHQTSCKGSGSPGKGLLLMFSTTHLALLQSIRISSNLQSQIRAAVGLLSLRTSRIISLPHPALQMWCTQPSQACLELEAASVYLERRANVPMCECALVDVWTGKRSIPKIPNHPKQWLSSKREHEISGVHHNY